jgi:two-component system, NtrC family, sensor kinase
MLYLLAPTVLVLAGYAYLRVNEGRVAAEAEFARRTAAASTAIRLAIERALRDEAWGEAARLAQDLVTKQTEIVRVRLLDQKLEPLVDRNLLPSDAGARPARLRRVLESGQADAEWRRAADLGLYSAILPVRPDGSLPTAVLEIVYLHGRLEDDLGEVTRQTAVQVGLVLIVLLGLGGFVLQRTVFRPLRDLTGAMHGVTDGGDLDTEVPVRRRDELGRVAAAFNAMIHRLRTARRRLDVELARTMDLSTQLLRTDSLAIAGRLCSGLAHEVGTPLNIIAGRAELVLQALPPADRYREDLQVILAQIERISRIIRAALDPFRPHAPDIQPTALAPLVEAILPLLRHFARSRGVTLGVALPAEVPPVRTDIGHFQHVLITLIMSAVDATPRGGRVELAAREDEAGVTISVRDNGPGIPADVLPKLFDPLAAVRRSGNGRGLGLATSQEFMKQLGTQIRVESAENAGTTFSVSLPRVPANGGEVKPG